MMEKSKNNPKKHGRLRRPCQIFNKNVRERALLLRSYMRMQREDFTFVSTSLESPSMIAR